MAIYEFYNKEEENFHQVEEPVVGEKGRLFSTLVTRFCFLLLFVADVAWLFYNAFFLILFTILSLFCGRKVGFFNRCMKKFSLNFRRSTVCGLSLLIGLFSPPFGIMVACTYFLMYDKAGMEEVVPGPLQSQFKDIFKTD